MESRGSVLVDPKIFLGELSLSFADWSRPVAVRLEQALRIRAEANLATDVLRRMILAVASVEALTPDEFWTRKQRKMLQRMVTNVRSCPGATKSEIDEIVECCEIRPQAQGRNRACPLRVTIRRFPVMGSLGSSMTVGCNGATGGAS